MRIVADENIPFVSEAFGGLGEVVLVSGRSLSRKKLSGADALLVRSVTKVDETLLGGTDVSFVGTATIGTDHIDLPYLAQSNIAFAAAPGSNATSVAEYVTASLLVVARRGGYRLSGRSIGIVGVGNVGSRVAEKAKALGMKVRLNDPPLARQTGKGKYLPLARLMNCDFVSIHTPLTMEGPDATYQLVNEDFVANMKDGSVLVNTSRGRVAEGRALKRALDSDHLSQVILDVWENEPEVDPSLLERAAIATPHIAGYGYDGKVRGTEMLYKALCSHIGAKPKWRASHSMPRAPHEELRLRTKGLHDEEIIHEAVLTVCDVEADDARMRGLLKIPREKRAAQFDSLRKTYPVRREFHNTTITLEGERQRAARKLSALGFRVA